MKVMLFLIVCYIALMFVACLDFDKNNADYIILLGCKLKNNKETFQMINRCNRAALYLHKNPDCKVIVTGGVTEGNKISEASVMANLLDERHILSKRIICEDQAQNTIENIIYSKEFITPNSKVLICSNDYHMLRTKLICSKFNLKVKSLSCQTLLFELLMHIPIEFIYTIKNMIELSRIKIKS